MKCCTGQQRKGNMIHTLTFTGIEGREVILIELCCLKLFKGTHSLFDIFGWSKYPKQNHSDTLEESTVTQYIQGWANRTLYNVFLINQCDPGLNPVVDAICELSLLLVLSFAPRGFPPDTTVKNQHFKISIQFVEVLPLKLSLVNYLLPYQFIY